MRTIQRLSAVGALAALTLSAAACTNSEQASTQAPATTAGAAAAAPSSEPATSSSAASSGVTQVSDIFGPGCSAVPTSGKGAPSAMVADPVATAAANNPLLTTLTKALNAAGLTDTLNKPEAQYTVFAPDDAAFAKLPAGQLDSLLADPAGQLADILTYHVVAQRYDAAGLLAAGTVVSVEGKPVTIGGTAQAPTVDGNPVACANIPTANATVFIIDSVLTPPAG